jgi:hypothetical protein
MPDSASMVSRHRTSRRPARSSPGPEGFDDTVGDRSRPPRGDHLAAAEQFKAEYAGQLLTSFFLFALKALSMGPNNREDAMETTKDPIPWMERNSLREAPISAFVRDSCELTIRSPTEWRSLLTFVHPWTPAGKESKPAGSSEDRRQWRPRTRSGQGDPPR